MYKGQELVDLATTKIGTRGAEAKRYCGLPSNANYCDAFVTWLFYKCGVKELFCGGSRQTYCPTTINLIRKQMPQIPIYLALPGDVIFYDWEPNGNPNHIGIAQHKISDLEIATVEGNTSMQNKQGVTIATGVVADKIRTYYATVGNKKKVVIQGLFRPQFPVDKSEFDATKDLVIDGEFGFNSIACLQSVLKQCGTYKGEIDAILGLNTVKALQRRAGTEADGSWGPNTTKAVQRMTGAKADGFFGPASTKALQKWINAQTKYKATEPAPTSKPSAPAQTTTKTNAQKVSDKARELAWPAGTPEAKYRKKGGSPTEAFKKAWKKWFPHTKMNTGCHSFVRLVLRDSIDPKAMPSLDWPKIVQYFRKSPKYEELKVNFKQSQLKEGDIRIHYTDHSHHIWIITKSGGKWYRAEANQGSTNDRWAHLNGSTAGNEKKHKKDFLFRPKG